MAGAQVAYRASQSTALHWEKTYCSFMSIWAERNALLQDSLLRSGSGVWFAATGANAATISSLYAVSLFFSNGIQVSFQTIPQPGQPGLPLALTNGMQRKNRRARMISTVFPVQERYRVFTTTFRNGFFRCCHSFIVM